MSKHLVALLLALSMLLSGCAWKTDGSEEKELVVYRRGADGGLVEEGIPAVEGELPLNTVVRALNMPPAEEGMANAFPAGVWVEGCSLEAGRVQISMSKNYRGLSGLDKTITDQTIAFTVLSLDQVYAVDIIQNGETFSRRLTADDAVLSDVHSKSGERIVKLFLPDFEQLGLAVKTVKLPVDGSREMWELVAQELLAQPDVLPKGTQIQRISCEEGLCVVQLSPEFYTTEPELAHKARLIIASFVNSLCYLEAVEEVILCVGETPISSYGAYHTVWPMRFEANLLS